VLGAGIGVQKRHRDRCGARGQHGIDGRVHRGHVQRLDDFAAGADALVHLVDAVAAEQRHRLFGIEVVSLVTLLPTDDQHIAEAARSDQRRRRALAFDHRVSGNGRGVQNGGYLRSIDVGAAEQIVEATQDAFGEIGRRTRYLQRPHQAAIAIMEDAVGKCSPDVEGYAQHGTMLTESAAIDPPIYFKRSTWIVDGRI
jgi:hypothetical protein